MGLYLPRGAALLNTFFFLLLLLLLLLFLFAKQHVVKFLFETLLGAALLSPLFFQKYF